ncbi:MAG: hypothetical protein D6731_17700 [Planctomycetota bacterium]|nr:MAG: hypothetical protein D6731_17700 [Planctomycetota bacterium]
MKGAAGAVAAGVLAGVALQLAARWRGHRRLEAALKLGSSAGLLVFVALVDCGQSYGRWIEAGLVASFVGDAFLIGRSRQWLGLGLAAFLAAHLATFGAALDRIAIERVSPPAFTLLVAAVVFVGAATFLRVRPRLGTLLLPAAIYTLALCSMAGAAATAFLSEWWAAGHWLLGLGGALFLASDVAVALQRFEGDSLRLRLWGLPAYYAGQLCLAASTAWPGQ